MVLLWHWAPEQFPRHLESSAAWLPGTCRGAWAALAPKAFHRDSTVGFTELVLNQLQTISHVRTWEIIETRLVLTASGPHVNLALMWSLSLKGWWIEFLFGYQKCPFHYFLAVAVGTLGLWYYCYPGLLAAISSDNFTSISNFAPFTPHFYYQETGTRV